MRTLEGQEAGTAQTTARFRTPPYTVHRREAKRAEMQGQQRPGAEDIAIAAETALKPEAPSDETARKTQGDKESGRSRSPDHIARQLSRLAGPRRSETQGQQRPGAENIATPAESTLKPETATDEIAPRVKRRQGVGARSEERMNRHED